MNLHTRRRFFRSSALALGTMGLASLIERAASGAETATRPAGAPVRWIRERIGRGTDAVAGAKVWQLTSAPLISHGIYG